MTTSQDYLDFVLEQLPPLWSIRSRKMFGEYMVYLNDKPILMLCDNTVFVKKLPVLDEIMANSPCGCPYEGAKESYLLVIADRDIGGSRHLRPQAPQKGERGEVNTARDGFCRPFVFL